MYFKQKFEDTKGHPEAVNWRKTENTMAQGKRQSDKQRVGNRCVEGREVKCWNDIAWRERPWFYILLSTSDLHHPLSG